MAAVSGATPSRPVTQLHWFAPFLLALSVGGWQIGRPGVWRDEVATWWSATVPVGALVDMSRETDAVGFLY